MCPTVTLLIPDLSLLLDGSALNAFHLCHHQDEFDNFADSLTSHIAPSRKKFISSLLWFMTQYLQNL